MAREGELPDGARLPAGEGENLVGEGELPCSLVFPVGDPSVPEFPIVELSVPECPVGDPPVPWVPEASVGVPWVLDVCACVGVGVHVPSTAT